MSVVAKAYSRALSVSQDSFNTALHLKQAGFISDQLAGDQAFGEFRSQTAHRTRYSLYRGWLYSAINALATEAAGQSVNVFKSKRPEANIRAILQRVKGNRFSLTKHEQGTLEVVEDHPLVSILNQPNVYQHRFQFVYSFVANLLLTGWSYIVAGEGENGTELYSLPTTWITPIHKQGLFSEFKLRDPNKPQSEGEVLTREQVAFAHLPDPSNPLGAIAPVSTQMMAIRIDDHIQTSQERFFENGIFPSVIITVGKNPHPDLQGGGGVRPRLTGPQRRQINSIIRKTMGGVANYGNPAIVDGLIEKIDRLSATQVEMGWEKSEDKVKRRILSAFSLHSFVLGEDLPGSYAQAYIVDERTCRKLNAYLGLLSTVISNFVGNNEVEVFWEPCEPFDPELERKWWEFAGRSGYLDESEVRAKIKLPPRESEFDDSSSTLLNTVGGMNGVILLFKELALGTITPEMVIQLLTLLFKIPPNEAQNIVNNSGNLGEQQALEESVDSLRQAIKALGYVNETSSK